MPRLVLMRHAQAEATVPDKHRALTRVGRLDAEATGAWLRDNSLESDLVLVSPALRTRQTTALLGLNAPTKVVAGLYECPPAVVIETARRHLDGVDDTFTLLIVGHYPGVPDAAAILAPGADVVAFTTGTALALMCPAGPLIPGSAEQIGVFHP